MCEKVSDRREMVKHVGRKREGSLHFPQVGWIQDGKRPQKGVRVMPCGLLPSVSRRPFGPSHDPTSPKERIETGRDRSTGKRNPCAIFSTGPPNAARKIVCSSKGSPCIQRLYRYISHQPIGRFVQGRRERIHELSKDNRPANKGVL